ncbi:MAG: FecR family protein [Deltaproteobacteria bacterium]|jgi:hypothetical protein|nr:FecR family protein [Deltaproteobacteria bacterium]
MSHLEKYLILPLVLAVILLRGGSELLAQTGEVTILKIAGKAEILEQGRSVAAKEGQRIRPGQSVRLVGGGEVSISSQNDRIRIRVQDDTTLKYDGDTGANTLPWSRTNPDYRKIAAEDKKVPQFSVPVGRLEVEVVPGQELRLVCPLIMAAVRGTVFLVNVEYDGTSRISTLEGVVATYGRHGESRLTLAGQSAEVTAGLYTGYLISRGVNVPSGGTWQDVPAGTQERVDNETLGGIFAEGGGGGLLGAVLANPSASPTAGVNALAVEAAGGDTGSLFVESPLGQAQGPGAASETGAASGTGGLPNSSLLAQGLPDIVKPVSSGSGPKPGFVVSFLAPPGSSFIDRNYVKFDLDLGTGHITNASFALAYARPHSTFGEAYTTMTATGGSGRLDPATLNFLISDFDSSSGSEFWENYTYGAYGYLGSGTTLSGSLSGPVNYGQAVSGALTPDYFYYSMPSGTDMPSSLPFSGLLEQKPMVHVLGTFSIPNVLTAISNSFEFSLNLNTGRITDPFIVLDYTDTSSRDIIIYLYDGTGQLTNGAFAVDTTKGSIAGYYGYKNPQGRLSGTFNSSDPAAGTLVNAGGALNLSAGAAPAYIPASVPIAGGQIQDSLPPPANVELRTVHFIGAISGGTYYYSNFLTFDLDLATGLIENGAFDLEYDRYHPYTSTARTTLRAYGGSGSLNPRTLNFSISGFDTVYGPRNQFQEDVLFPYTYGQFGPGTTLSGTLGGSPGYGQTVSGTLAPDYNYTFLTSPSDMPAAVAFGGTVEKNPLVNVSGTFNIPDASNVYANHFGFRLNLNTGAVSAPIDFITVDYEDTSSNPITMKLSYGSGSLTNNAFAVTTNEGGVVAGMYIAMNPTATLTGTFDTNRPDEGAAVNPGGTLTLSGLGGTPPSYLPTTIPIQGGQVGRIR